LTLRKAAVPLIGRCDMVELKIALMVGLIGLLLLTMYFTALPNRMSI
jgi:hypothetical protein